MRLAVNADIRDCSSTFPDYIAHGYPQLPARDKRAFIVAFATFINTLHGRGVPTWKYPADRIKVTVVRERWTFALVGPDAGTPTGRALCRSLRRKGLSTLYAEFLTTTCRAERLRFYQAYWIDRRKLSSQREELENLDRAAIALAR